MRRYNPVFVAALTDAELPAHLAHARELRDRATFALDDARKDLAMIEDEIFQRRHRP